MQDKFIEKGTHYPLKQGRLSLFETNCSCKDVQFHFKQYVMTLMLSGHKTIESENLKFEFFPGTFFIPEKETINQVSIPNASFTNPTQCLVLELNPSFLKRVYEGILYAEGTEKLLQNLSRVEAKHHFLSNDQLLINAFKRLYDIQLNDNADCKPLIDELIIKEIIYRLFSTEGMALLKHNFKKSIEDDCIRKVINYISLNISQKITIEELTKLAGIGQTTFFKLFKKATGTTPVEYILRERIRQAKIMIQKGRFSLKEIAYKSGFNSYEYFCSSFKKIEGLNPSQLKGKIEVSV